jgi:hypothetical protein
VLWARNNQTSLRLQHFIYLNIKISNQLTHNNKEVKMNNISKTLSLSTTLILLLAGCSQQQVSDDGASQVATSSQAQQEQVVKTPETPKVVKVVKPKSVRSAGGHVHPANRCTKSIRHNHPNGNRSHSHKYSCQGTRRAGGNKWTHSHPANRCTKSIRHTHKFKGQHNHKYSCQGKRGGSSINVHALQRKLKAKGYYRGPINGVINPATRSALKRYQQGHK